MPSSERAIADSSVRRGAVVLCGGGSRRMGQDKAWLAFGEETLLQRVLRIVSGVVAVDGIAVAAARNQRLPELPPGVRVLRDQTDDAGPLPALVRGLAELADSTDVAFVTACDAPLINAAAIELLFHELNQAGDRFMAAVPYVDGRRHPLSAVYRVAAAGPLGARGTQGERSLRRALGSFPVAEIQEETLRAVDPRLGLVANCNTPEELRTALDSCGW